MEFLHSRTIPKIKKRVSFMSVKNINRKTHRIYYHFNQKADIIDVQKNAHTIFTFDHCGYINLGNGYAIKKLRNFDKHIEVETPFKDITVPIAKLYDHIRFVNDFKGNRIYGRKKRKQCLVSTQVIAK
ncbi:hypothetical protein DD607_04890 [Salmonella sp. 3DZ2-4SM]|nr:hypothetical protein DD607_04890 [Salmonella sp. 3DZ2-4SM]